jgi:hypothetical protein
VPPSVLPKRESVTDSIQRQLSIFRDACDEGAGVLLGRLDHKPLLGTSLHLGDELAVSYEKVVEHRKASDFQKQEDKARGL